MHWTCGGLHIEELGHGFNDEGLHRLFGDAEKIGLDVPFGWPTTFVSAVVGYRDTKLWPAAERDELIFRATDRHVIRATGKRPLSVSADRIAFCAFRAARLLSQVVASGEDVDRSGGGRFVEVYPAAALRVWRLTREEVAERLGVPGLVRRTDDELDALISALVARAAALGLCEPVPAGEEESASREGWIALPLPDSFEQLC